MRSWTGRRRRDDHDLVGARSVGYPGGDGLIVAARRGVGLVPQRHDEWLTGLGARVGKADDRLACELFTHQVAEIRRVDQCATVFDLPAAADDGGLTERFDGLHGTERVNETISQQ